MSAQSALSIFGISDLDARNFGILHEANLLTRRYVERASRSQIRIQGVEGSTIYLAEVDPILSITLTGWMQSRGGLTNAHPGTRIAWNMVENWRNGTTEKNKEDHFGWDVNMAADDGGSHRGFVVREVEAARSPGSLSEVTIQLALECTATGGGGGPGVGGGGSSNPPEIIPPSSGVPRIVTIYTSAGTWQYITYQLNPTLDGLFGSDTGAWDPGEGYRPVSGVLPEYPEAPVGARPFNVRGVNVQAASGYGSAAGGEWLTGSASEVTDSGLSLGSPGVDMWFFVLSNAGTVNRNNTFMVTGTFASEAAALASIGKTAADFESIYRRTATGSGWTKGAMPQGDPLSWFQQGA